jgi:hypothetical protein
MSDDKHAAYGMEFFPEQIVKPWRERVERELPAALGPGWDASIRPLGEDGQVFYTLTAEYTHHDVNERVSLASVSTDLLIQRALMFERYWEAVTS